MLYVILAVVAVVFIIIAIVNNINEKEYLKLEEEVLNELDFLDWDTVTYSNKHVRISYIDEYVTVKSRQTLEKYDDIKFFKENKDKLAKAKEVIAIKNFVAEKLDSFLDENTYKTRSQYNRIEKQINEVISRTDGYIIGVSYISSAGNHLGKRIIIVDQYTIDMFEKDPSLLMGKGEYNKFLKEQQKDALDKKRRTYYGNVNKIIDYASESKDALVIRGSNEEIDSLVAKLFEKTVNSIQKIKTVDSEEWAVVKKYITGIYGEIKEVVDNNRRILDYYKSSDFLKIKETCNALMSSQKEFNEYIQEKVESVSRLFGTRVVRNETINEDEYQYIRPYKKTITPFTAEVSATVFASAENSPIEYVIKNFYPNKVQYPEQIQKLHLLVEEIATLKEAKRIIESYKEEYRQYLGEVPEYIMREDEAGFYSRLGFANIDESTLAVEYKFSYTSGGGMAKRTFAVPMTEETIVELINALESKLTISAFTKEQRALMTNKLREFIKSRDRFTCCNCGNSVHNEPNLLLEIDHIIPVSKGGCTVEENLQTLCWKCNRAKSNKLADL